MKRYLFLLFSLTVTALAAPPVTLSGRACSDASTLILDLYADSVVPLRTFGVTVGFDKTLLNPQTITVNDSQWFLSGSPGTHLPSPAVVQKPGAIRVVGARFGSLSPSAGVVPGRYLLASLKFQRLSATLPTSFDISLAGPSHYASFVGTDDTIYDSSIDGLGPDFTLVFCPLPADTDGDLLPDSYEVATFGSLSASNGLGDTDGDGTNDLAEWNAGTNPTQSDSMPNLRFDSLPGESKLRIKWQGVAGRTYSLLRSTTLGLYVPIAEGLASTENEVSVKDSEARSFFQLRIENPSSNR